MNASLRFSTELVRIALRLKLARMEIIKVTTSELLSECLNTSAESIEKSIDTYCSLLLIDRREVLSLK